MRWRRVVPPMRPVDTPMVLHCFGSVARCRGGRAGLPAGHGADACFTRPARAMGEEVVLPMCGEALCICGCIRCRPRATHRFYLWQCGITPCGGDLLRNTGCAVNLRGGCAVAACPMLQKGTVHLYPALAPRWLRNASLLVPLASRRAAKCLPSIPMRPSDSFNEVYASPAIVCATAKYPRAESSAAHALGLAFF